MCDLDEVARRFAVNVRVLREARGWGVGRLAAECGLSRRAVELLEVQRRKPSLGTLLLMAAAFELDDPMELLRAV